MTVPSLSFYSDVRYERKFSVPIDYGDHLIGLISTHPAIFSEIYCPRYINSIYFDSFDLKNYYDCLNGVNERMKVRIRWYGDIAGSIMPNLEFKQRCNFIIKKRSFAILSPIFFSGYHSREFSSAIRDMFDVPQDIKEYLVSLECVVLVRYLRRYFQSSDKKYRLTLDRDLEFYNLLSRGDLFKEKITNCGQIILEMKYKKDNDDKASYISNQFPFRLSKNSKYAMGIECFN